MRFCNPSFSAGPHYKVRDPVPTCSELNQFTIDSDFGVFEADGNEMLLQRLKEIDAIARLKEVSRTDEFKKCTDDSGKESDRVGQEHRHGSGEDDFQRSKRTHEIYEARRRKRSRDVGNKSESTRGEGSRMKERSGSRTKNGKIELQPGGRSIQHQHSAAEAAGRRRVGFVGRWIHL